MPAKAGTQPAYAILATLGLGPSLRWGDGFWPGGYGIAAIKRFQLIANLVSPFEIVLHLA
tara:strand:+ start:344 stop:523 length:180 start_codon:yes stop_codon:yes gene_type:complete